MKQEPQVFTKEDHGIEYFRLSSLKAQLKLEAVGLKSRGGPIRPRIAKEFGLSARASHAEFIEAIQKKMDAILAEKGKK